MLVYAGPQGPECVRTDSPRERTARSVESYQGATFQAGRTTQGVSAWPDRAKQHSPLRDNRCEGPADVSSGKQALPGKMCPYAL